MVVVVYVVLEQLFGETFLFGAFVSHGAVVAFDVRLL